MNNLWAIIILVVSSLLGGGFLALKIKNSAGNPKLPPAATMSPEQREQAALEAKKTEETRIEESNPVHIFTDPADPVGTTAHLADVAAIQTGFAQRLRDRLNGILQRNSSGGDAAGGNRGS